MLFDYYYIVNAKHNLEFRFICAWRLNEYSWRNIRNRLKWIFGFPDDKAFDVNCDLDDSPKFIELLFYSLAQFITSTN